MQSLQKGICGRIVSWLAFPLTVGKTQERVARVVHDRYSWVLL